MSYIGMKELLQVPVIPSKDMKGPLSYDNCKGCKSKCEHAGKDRPFCYRDKSCKVTVVTNADRIRAMNDEELAEFIRSMVDDTCTHDVACYGCIHYGTHHSDPAHKGTNLYECDGCSCEGIGLDVLKWLQQPVEER